MLGKWSELRHSHWDIRSAIIAGMEKLEDYIDIIRGVPVYTLAMGLQLPSTCIVHDRPQLLAINPSMKLDFYRFFRPDEYVSAKNVFVDAVRYVILTIFAAAF